MIKLTVLIENHGDAKRELEGEHGLSILLETDSEKILFDTGQSGDFLHNADKLQLDITRIDRVVLSHGHYDHTGGIIRCLKRIGHSVPVYVGKGFFEKKYKSLGNGDFRYNGNPFTKEELAVAGGQIVEIVQPDFLLTENIRLFRAFQSKYAFEAPNEAFYLKTTEGYTQDTFQEELALAVATQAGILVVTGCAHPGILGMAEKIQGFYKLPLAGIVGGSHLVHADEERLKVTIAGLRRLNPGFLALSHCTGEENITRLSEAFGERFRTGVSGSVLECL